MNSKTLSIDSPDFLESSDKPSWLDRLARRIVRSKLRNLELGELTIFEDGQIETFGHLGDSNIHFVMTIGNYDPAQVGEAMKIVYENLRPFGGSISAEHGIGIEKRSFLPYSRSEIEIDMMRRLKKALDPDGILNPGKVVE